MSTTTNQPTVPYLHLAVQNQTLVFDPTTQRAFTDPTDATPHTGVTVPGRVNDRADYLAPFNDDDPKHIEFRRQLLEILEQLGKVTVFDNLKSTTPVADSILDRITADTYPDVYVPEQDDDTNPYYSESHTETQANALIFTQLPQRAMDMIQIMRTKHQLPIDTRYVTPELAALWPQLPAGKARQLRGLNPEQFTQMTPTDKQSAELKLSSTLTLNWLVNLLMFNIRDYGLLTMQYYSQELPNTPHLKLDLDVSDEPKLESSIVVWSDDLDTRLTQFMSQLKEEN